MERKHPIGLVDIISGYPNRLTGFIGLFAIIEARQGSGLGRKTYKMLEKFARTDLNATRLRLAVVDSNPVHAFWQRMGFEATGEAGHYRGEARTSSVSIMEKLIT